MKTLIALIVAAVLAVSTALYTGHLSLPSFDDTAAPASAPAAP